MCQFLRNYYLHKISYQLEYYYIFQVFFLLRYKCISMVIEGKYIMLVLFTISIPIHKSQ